MDYANLEKAKKEERLKVYADALETFGPEVQLAVALEEMSELQKELCKALRGFVHPFHVAEELADAAIMLEQIRYIFQDPAFWPDFPALAPVDRDIINIIKQTSTVQVELCKVLLQQAPPDCLLLESDEADKKLDFVATTFSVGPAARKILTHKIERLRQRIKDAKE